MTTHLSRRVRALLFWSFSSTAFALVTSCSKQDPDELADPDVAPRDTNPDGIAYPTDHLGSNARANGTRGDRIPNFAFQGYPNGDRSQGLQTISLADYFDPSRKRHKLLHIEVGATWCAYCSSEIEATVENKAALNAKGIAYLEVLVSGASAGFGPSQGELDTWIDRHHSNVDTAVDIRGRRLGGAGLIAVDVMPHDIVVDTRTMEILDSSPGTPIDIGVYDSSFLEVVESHPPSY